MTFLNTIAAVLCCAVLCCAVLPLRIWNGAKCAFCNRHIFAYCLPASVKSPEDISQRPSPGGQDALKPVSVRTMLQEVGLSRGLGCFAAPIAVVQHVRSDVEITNKHNWPPLG